MTLPDIKDTDCLLIIDVQKDPNLQIYKLLTDNSKTIDKLKSQSQVTTFINRLVSIENKYLIQF